MHNVSPASLFILAVACVSVVAIVGFVILGSLAIWRSREDDVPVVIRAVAGLFGLLGILSPAHVGRGIRPTDGGVSSQDAAGAIREGGES